MDAITMRNHVHGDHTVLQLKFKNHIVAIIVLLVAHYCAIVKLWPHGCHYLLHINVHHGATMLALFYNWMAITTLLLGH